MLVVVVEAVHIAGDISCCQGSICWQLQTSWVQQHDRGHVGAGWQRQGSPVPPAMHCIHLFAFPVSLDSRSAAKHC